MFTFAKASAIAEAKKVIRRLAKETVRQYGRLVAKVTHSSPHITLPLLLNQIQVYDNLIPSVVEAFRFLTPLSFDVLMWSLLVALSFSERDRLKEDGVNVADWLQNLARFASSAIRRHYASMDPAPLLRFVYAQLCDENGLDVILLQELLTLVAGIEKPENDSEALIEAHFGGPLLQSTIQEAAQVTSKPPRRAFAHLKAALESENLTRPLLIALAQAVDAAVYRMDYEHLKFTGSLVDVLQSTLQQYLRFLKAGNIEVDLCFEELCGEFKLTKASALYLLTFLGKPVSFAEDAQFGSFLKLFWSLEAIRIPEARYQLEAAKLGEKEKLLAELEALKHQRSEQLASLSNALVSSLTGSTDRAIITDTVLSSAIFPRLLQSPTSALLCADFLFLCHDQNVKNLSTLALFDAVFELPGRVLACLTEFEANCFGRFVQECLGKLQAWHQSEAKFTEEAQRLGFLKRWSELVGDVESIEDSKSVEDVEAIEDVEDVEEGELLEEIEEQEETELAEEQEEADMPTSQQSSTPHTSSQLNWQDFRHVCFKWHEKITNALLSCFSSSDFTAIRNAIIFSSRLQGNFPRLERQSRKLEVAVGELKEKDSREDVKVLATRYSALLAQNRPFLVKESKFHETDEPDEDEEAEEIKQVSQQTEKMKLKRSASEIDEQSSDSKRSRSGRHARDSRDIRDLRGERNARDARDSRDSRDSRDHQRDPQRDYQRDHQRDSRDHQRDHHRDSRDSRDSRDGRDGRDSGRYSSSSSSRHRESARRRY